MRPLILLLIAMLAWPSSLFSQATVAPVMRLQFLNNAAAACNGCKLYTYLAGTTTEQVVYTNSALSSAAPNPVVMNSAGRPSVSGTEVNLYQPAFNMRYILKTSADVQLWDADNIRPDASGLVLPSTFAVGDLLYADTTSTLARRAAVATGSVLASAGTNTAPVYTTTPLLDGVAFPATQVSSAGANTLDDYEEGTWTPVIGGSGGTSGQTYSAQTGTYTKIGKLVVAQFYVQLSVEGTITTSAQIQGLPFTAENTTGFQTPAAMMWGALATTWVSINAAVVPNTTAATLKGAAAAATASTTALTSTDIDASTHFYGVIIYRATQ